MSFHSLRGTRCASLIAASILIACGDDAPSLNTDPDATAETDGSDTDLVDADADALDPDAVTNDVTDTETTDVATNDTDTNTDTHQPSVPTATVTIDGTATEVTPSVRRGFVYTQAIQRSVTTELHQMSQIACEGSGGLTEGGRIINPISVGISGGFGSACDPGGNGENFRLGEENALFAVRQSCSGRTGACSHDFSESFLLRFGSCPYSNVRFTTQYNCEALFPGPSYLVEVPTSYGLLRAEGLDGLGEMSCEQRAAGFRLDGAPVTLGEGMCKVTIDERNPMLLSGRIEATLSLGGSDRQVVIDFGSRETETRTTLIAFFQDDLCATNSITTTVSSEGTDTFDVFVTGPLACQANPQRTIDPVTVSIRRPRSGEASNAGTLEQRTTITQGAYTFSEYSRFFSIDDSTSRTRLAAYEVISCQDEGRQTCLPSLPILYFQGTKPAEVSAGQ